MSLVKLPELYGFLASHELLVDTNTHDCVSSGFSLYLCFFQHDVLEEHDQF